LLIKSFIEEFGSCPNVLLKINGRPYGDNVEYFKSLEVAKNYPNIIVESKILSNEEYISFFKSIDCFVNISKGEGFSVPPREALALGIPCILSNNTAHATICNTGFVKVVEAKILEPACYLQYSNKNLGNFFNCRIEDVKEALRDVFENYEKYLHLARFGYNWVKKYQWKELKKIYLNLIKPKKIFFGDKNIVNNNFLMTNSKELFKKYMELN